MIHRAYQLKRLVWLLQTASSKQPEELKSIIFKLVSAYIKPQKALTNRLQYSQNLRALQENMEMHTSIFTEGSSRSRWAIKTVIWMLDLSYKLFRTRGPRPARSPPRKVKAWSVRPRFQILHNFTKSSSLRVRWWTSMETDEHKSPPDYK